jgi:hypothetical protein
MESRTLTYTCHVTARDPDCQAPATRRVRFADGDVALACEECALHLEELLGNGQHAGVRVETLRP